MREIQRLIRQLAVWFEPLNFWGPQGYYYGRVIKRFNYALAALVVGATALIGALSFVLPSSAVVLEVVPNSDNTLSGWTATGSNDATCDSGTACPKVAEGSTPNTGGYISTGTGGSDGETAFFNMTTLSNVNSATQIDVYVYAQSATNANGGTLDNLTININIGGADQTAVTRTPAYNTWGWTTAATFTGTWSQTDIDGMVVKITRSRQGSGNPSNQDDDVRIASVYANVDHSQTISTSQTHFRWRDDTTALNTDGGWLAAEDSNSIGNISKGTDVRLRFEVDRIGASVTDAYRLEWAAKSSTCSAATGWTRMDTASDAFALVDATNLTNGDAITASRLTGNNTTFVNGEAVDAGSSGDDTADNITLADDEYTEVEFAFEPTTSATNGETYCFRVTDAGTPLDAYSVYPELTTPPPGPMEITQEAYIFENDNGANVNSNTEQANFNTALTGVKKGERLTSRFHVNNTSGSSGAESDFALFYDRGDNIWTKVEQNQPPETGTGNCDSYASGSTGSDTWQCTVVDIQSTNFIGGYQSLAFDSSGNPWISYYLGNANSLIVAKFVGSGGNCDTYVAGASGSEAWQCTVVDDQTDDVGRSTSLAFDSSGNPWISYVNSTDSSLVIAEYVGSGGNCDTYATGSAGSDAWQCTVVDDQTRLISGNTSVAFDSSGNPWISFHTRDSVNCINVGERCRLHVANYVGSGGNCDTYATGSAGSDAWQCTVVDSQVGSLGADAFLAFDASDNPWISYYNNINASLTVANYVGSGGNCDTYASGSGGSDAWQCTIVDDQTNTVGLYNSMAFDPSGNAWVSYQNTSAGALVVATYVGSGGNCDTYASGSGGSDAWQCTIVDDQTNTVGLYNSMAFDPSGNAWVSYQNTTVDSLVVATYVGSGGNCDTYASGSGGSDAWQCTIVDDQTNTVGWFNSLAFDPSGNPWVAHLDGNEDSLIISRINRTGEITTSPGLAGSNGDALTASEADDGAGGTDCATASTFVNGKWFEAEEGSHVFDDDTCSEISFMIDTSQALEGETYRLVLATKDNWRQDKGVWRGPVDIDNYATFTIESDTDIRYSKDNSPKFASCDGYASGSSGSADWGCLVVDDQSNFVGDYSSIAFDSSGLPWVSYWDATTASLIVANYVGSGGNCDTYATGSAGSDAWQCTVVDDQDDSVGTRSSIAFDPKGNPLVAYMNTTDFSLHVAQYVGSGGNCDTYATGSAGSDAWQCTVVDDQTDRVGYSISLALNPSGSPWISYRNLDNISLHVAQYVGSGGNCDTYATGSAGSDAWQCTVVDDQDDQLGTYTSLSFDLYGKPWISYNNNTDFSLIVAQYVGSGGNCDTYATGSAGSDAWQCTVVDDQTDRVGWYSSLAFDSSGNPWVSYHGQGDGLCDTANECILIVAQYVGSGGNCDTYATGSAGSDAWQCTVVDDQSDSVGLASSLAIDPSGNPWVSYRNSTDGSLIVANYVGSGGNCDTYATGSAGSDAWQCTVVDDQTDSVGSYTSLAFDTSGTPWVSYQNLGDGVCNSANECTLTVAKLHLPPNKPSANVTIPYATRSAGSGDLRYRLDDLGYSDSLTDDTNLDPNAAVLNQRPIYNFTREFDAGVYAPNLRWTGQSTVSLATNNANIEVYRFGTTNAWETVTTETSCAADTDCTVTAIPSGPASEYYETINGEYAAHFRIWQEEHTTSQTLKTDEISIFQPGPPMLTQAGYIFESDDGINADTNTPQAAGNTSITAKKGERLNLRLNLEHSGALDANTDTDYGLFYDRGDNIWTKVEQNQPPETGAGSGCNVSGWTCGVIDDRNNSVDNAGRVAISPSGQPWEAYYDATSGRLEVARYVGSGGTGCNNSTAWSCEVVDGSSNTGHFPEIEFAPDGTAWVAYHSPGAGDNLRAARYVGSGGNCDTLYSGSDAWECWEIETSVNVDFYSGLAINSSGNPVITYHVPIGAHVMFTEFVGGGTGSGCASSDWDGCYSVEQHGSGGDTDIVVDSSGKYWIAYGSNADLFIAEYVGSGGSCDNTAWECYPIHVDGTASYYAISLAIAPNGNPAVAYYENTDEILWIATYEGSGNTGGCDTNVNGTGNASLWDCTLIQGDTGSNDSGRYSSLVYGPDGSPIIAYQDGDGCAADGCGLAWARYVGGGNGSGCTNTNWTCETLLASDNAGAFTDIALLPNGNPIITHNNYPVGDRSYAILDRAGELTVSPSLSASGSDVLSESHVDMTTTSDTTNRDDADCLTGGANWNNGLHFITEEGSGLSLPAGNSTLQCTELSFTIDTSQAIEGETYRLVIATKDNWRADKGPWRGPIGIDNYATITIETASDVRYSKDNLLRMSNCTNINWGCSIDVDDTVSLTGYDTSMADDPYGVPWISYYNGSDQSLMVATYVGSGGNCTDTAWQCTEISDPADGVGQYSSIDFDASGTAWISYHNLTSGSLMVAKYVGSGGNCTSTAWQCTEVDDSVTDTGEYTSLEFDAAGDPLISYYNVTNGSLMVAQYVGSGGNCTSTAWQCTEVDNLVANAGSESSMTIGSNGSIWISYRNTTSGSLMVAQYVGSGGNCTSTAWQCTEVDDTVTSTGRYTSIALDESGTPWASYWNNSSGSLMVAQYVGSGGNCTSTAWQCTEVDDSVADTGRTTSIAFDSQNNAWVSYRNLTDGSLMVANYVGSGGNCDVVSGSDAWNCSEIDGTVADTGEFTSIAFDMSGTPWVSYRNNTSGSLAVAKLNMPPNPPSANASGPLIPSGDLRYRLDDGRAPRSGSFDLVCGSTADSMGYCGLWDNDSEHDSLTTQGNETPMYAGAVRFDDNTQLPTVYWEGRTNLAPSTASTAGDIVLQVYRFGTTNAWETVVSETSASNCSTVNCALNGVPTGTVSEYFEDIGGEKWFYFRVYQISNGSSITFETDKLLAAQTQQRLRGGRQFQGEILRPFETPQ